MSENDRLPGWPYFLAALFIVCAYQAARDLPNQNDPSSFYDSAKSKLNQTFDDDCISLIDNARVRGE
jgi:hypothetical protein